MRCVWVRRTNLPIAGPGKARVLGPSTINAPNQPTCSARYAPSAEPRCPRAARLQHRGHAAPSRRNRNESHPRRTRCSHSRSSWMARRQRPQGSQKHLAPAAAAACAGAQPARKYLAIHAGELAVEPHLQILRRNRRSLLLRVEYAHRSTVENHVHRSPRLGSRRSLIVRVGIRPESPGLRDLTPIRTLLWPPASARLRSYSGRSPHSPSPRGSRGGPGDIFGLLLPDAAPPELLGFDDRTMMYEEDAQDWEAQVHWHGDQLRR
jgi:hypothetical protein